MAEQIARLVPGSARAWLLAARPPTLAAALVPVGVGTAVAQAEGQARALPALAALVGALLIQVGSNFANDAYDFEKGADQEDRLGPPRAAAQGLLSAAQLRVGVLVVFVAALLAGLYLASVSSPWILLLGFVSMAAAVGYTGGPFPLAYHGLGDLFVFVFFGLVAVAGTAYVQLQSIPLLALPAGAAIGALSNNILVVNNLRDIPTDTRARKRTLAVRFGERFCQLQYGLMLLLGYGMLVVLAFQLESFLPALPAVTIPWAALLWRSLWTQRGAALNPVLKRTAALLMVFGLLLSVGLGWS